MLTPDVVSKLGKPPVEWGRLKIKPTLSVQSRLYFVLYILKASAAFQPLAGLLAPHNVSPFLRSSPEVSELVRK